MDKNEFIIAEPQMYLETQNKALEKRLKGIKIGDVISTILNWNEEIDTEINEAKKAKLLEQHFNLADNQGEVIDKLKVEHVCFLQPIMLKF